MNDETKTACRTPCDTCPFDGSDAVEDAINLGCVPSVYEIMQYKRETNHNWGCHSDEDNTGRMCAGFVRACREKGLDYKNGPLLSFKDWNDKGPPIHPDEFERRVIGSFVCPHDDGDFTLKVYDLEGLSSGHLLIRQEGQGQTHDISVNRQESLALAKILIGFTLYE